MNVAGQRPVFSLGTVYCLLVYLSSRILIIETASLVAAVGLLPRPLFRFKAGCVKSLKTAANKSGFILTSSDVLIEEQILQNMEKITDTIFRVLSNPTLWKI